MQEGERELLRSRDGAGLPDSPARMVSFDETVTGLPIPSSQSKTNLIALSIRCPSLADASAESTTLSVPANSTILQVKKIIESTWEGRPQAVGMRMFRSGQILTDEMIIDDLVPLSERGEPTAVHLVIRPSAWTQPRPNLYKISSSDKRPAPLSHSTTTSKPATSSSSAVPSYSQPAPASLSLPDLDRGTKTAGSSRYRSAGRHFTAYVEDMDPSNYESFRSLLMWSHNTYLSQYGTEWRQAYDATNEPAVDEAAALAKREQAAQAMGCTIEEMDTAASLIERDVLRWEPVEVEAVQLKEDGGASTMLYKPVFFQSLPYLLQMKRNPAADRLKIILHRIKQLNNLVMQLNTLMEYVKVLEETKDMRSQVDSLISRVQTSGLARPPATRSYRLRLVFDMNQLVNVALPAFFLSFKVTLLVYVFTRGATMLKTCLIGGAGLLFVILEAYRMAQGQIDMQRRAAARRAGRDGQQQAGAAPTGAGSAGAAGSSNANADVNSEEDVTMESLRPHVPARHRAGSPLTVQYWIEAIAFVGLASEEEEFGWLPIRTRPVRVGLGRLFLEFLLKYVCLPYFLFFMTLVPELEQKRRREIEKREELIRSTAKKVEERRERLAAKSQKESASQEASTIAETPSFLQHRYCQRVLKQQRTGRQIDIAQEMEAAAEAAAAAGQGRDGDQADMGFL